MPGLWRGHVFSDAELQFWSQEIFVSALDLPDADRAAFVTAACDGSDALRTEVESLLSNAWPDTPPVLSGRCRPGDVVRDCFILRLQGRGGMGEVYKAIQCQLRRLVAVKIVQPGQSAWLLGKEAAMTARLVHPHIAAVYDADLAVECPSIVMEYVDGISLRAWLERHNTDRAASSDTVRRMIRQLADALGEAHRQGLVHGDIKPENILLTSRAGQMSVKVVDFGVARRVDTPGGVTVGTPGYVAPEQLTGTPPDARADLFALGVVLYELITGRQPFTGRSDVETFFNTLNVDPDFSMDGPYAELLPIARRALEKSPAKRYPSADALIVDIDHATEGDADAGLNPLISELPSSVQGWWARRSSGFVGALLSMLWGCASLILSIAARAACVRVVWVAGGARTHEMVYGYAVEPNAGLWYVFGASVCFLTGYAILEAGATGLARTASLSSLEEPAAGPAGAVRTIAALNRRYFRYTTPLIIVLAVSFVAVPELAFRRSHAFGWVQADLAGEQVGKRYDELKRAGRVGDLGAVAGLCETCEITVRAVYNTTAGFQRPSGPWFAVFLIIALTHQIVFVAFLLWMGMKILFLFGVLSMALLGDRRVGLRLVPDFQDKDDYRFGLGRLDNVYYGILVLAAAGSVGVFLQAAANVSKGTYFWSGDPAPALIGQAVTLLATLTLLAVALATPVCVFLFLTIKAIDEELARLSSSRKRLEARLAETRSSDERARLEFDIDVVLERRTTLKRQSLLPIRQPAFLTLLCASLVVLVGLPLSMRWFGDDVQTDVRAGHSLSRAVCAACGNEPRTGR
jgi:hypothetical protein